MKLILLRHGETQENLNAIIQGQTGGLLSARGHQQAQVVARRLQEEKIDVIYSSDLQRTKDTIKYVARYHAVPLQYAPELRERALGVYERGPAQKYFDDLAASGESTFKFKPQGGETYYEMQERAAAFIATVVERHPDESVLCCSHGGTIFTLLSSLLKTPFEAMQVHIVRNTALSILEIDGGQFKVLTLNCIKHLEDAGVPEDSTDKYWNN